MPVLADVEEIHGVLASIASRHFKESSVKEGRDIGVVHVRCQGKRMGDGSDGCK